ncbi:hypothetical protein ACAG26_04135 [Mycobacterium sp. pUA109]|uniref:hypothetical protein n=1 Tax=Mycobacterium sp. pUA109 TaxID=3238982 RepID=UPI00351B0163
MQRLVDRPVIGSPDGHRPDRPGIGSAQHGDLGKPTPPGPVAPEVHQHLVILSVVEAKFRSKNACLSAVFIVDYCSLRLWGYLENWADDTPGGLLARAALACEIRRMNLQGWLDRVVSDHRPSFATLRYDIERAIPKVGEKWKPEFDAPRDIHGQAFCTDVRLMVLRMRELRGPNPWDTLVSRCGSGLSVQLSNGRGMGLRVRRWPSKVLHGDRVRIVTTPGGGGQELVRASTEPNKQMPLDEGSDTELFPAPKTTAAGKPDIFSLWWPTEDGCGLAEAELAAVIDADSASRVQILATSPLPPVTESPLLALPKRTAGPASTFGDLEPPVAGSGTHDPDEPA